MKPGKECGKALIFDVRLNEVIPLINWKMFFLAWKIQGKYLETFPYKRDRKEMLSWISTVDPKERGKAEEAVELYFAASEIIEELQENGLFDGMGTVRFEKARSDAKNLYIGTTVFPMLRQQRKDSDFLSVCDYLDHANNTIGLFSVTAGHYLDEYAKELENGGDDYKSLIVQSLSDRIVEASAEWLQKLVNEKYMRVTIRPAWGYPMLPDQTMILLTQEFLPYDKIGVILTENGAMYPSSSISGLLIGNPTARYFMIGEIGDDQIEDYAERRGMTPTEVKGILRQL